MSRLLLLLAFVLSCVPLVLLGWCLSRLTPEWIGAHLVSTVLFGVGQWASGLVYIEYGRARGWSDARALLDKWMEDVERGGTVSRSRIDADMNRGAR